MSNPIGFVLVSHNEPDQTTYLCQRLTAMFDAPPIALHHDFGQCAWDTTKLPANVYVVAQWSKTAWGQRSVIDANRKALRLLYDKADPDWVVSLSTACYPIKTAARTLAYLRAASADAFMETKRVRYDKRRDRSNPKSLTFPDSWYFDVVERYLGVRISSYKMMAMLGQPHRAIYLKDPFFTQRLTPFKKGIDCYAGDAWYTFRRTAAQIVLEQTAFSTDLYKHYEFRRFPEESYYHTLLRNTPGVRVDDHRLTYTDWTDKSSAHPKLLGYEDLTKLTASECLFARKFPMSVPLLQAVDAAVAASAFL